MRIVDVAKINPRFKDTLVGVIMEACSGSPIGLERMLFSDRLLIRVEGELRERRRTGILDWWRS